MNKRILVLGVLTLLLLSGCTASTGGESPATIPPSPPVATSVVEAAPPSGDQALILEAEGKVGFQIKVPDQSLLADYVLESAVVDEATKSVCLQFRHAAPDGDSLLFVAQGPAGSAPELEVIPDAPEYLVAQEEVEIGGAEKSYHLAGWRRSAWACTDAAEKEVTRYSFAVAPWLTWQAEGRQFDLYSASGGCGTPGGLTHLDLLRIAESLTGTSAHPGDELDPECLLSIEDATKLAGFEVRQPGYLPEAVSFHYARVEKTPNPVVTLLYLHDEHPDMGRFFQIMQAKEAPSFFLTSCTGTGSNACEMLNAGETPVVYQSTGPTEQLDWLADGIYFSLLRSAGEPGKAYKDELLKVAASMK